MSYEKFQNFGSVLESEVLDEQQMNSLEAGGSCEKGCKKSCKPGNQKEYTHYTVPGPVSIEQINELE